MAIRRLEAVATPWTPERSAVAHADGLERFGLAIERHFGPIDTILDVGAGSGLLALALDCGGYVGIDQTQNPGVMVGDAHALPFPDGSFDVVASKQTLPHLADPARALGEMMRVARRGVIIQQEFPEDGVGWAGHSLVHFDSPDDVLALLPGATFDGTDFVWRRS